MSPDHDYATARRLIDPDTNYTVLLHTDAGWTPPTDPDHQEVSGLDLLLAVRRTLRAQPAGRVENTGRDELAIRTHDGRLWLRFTDSTRLRNGPGPSAPGR
ncbi:hypothetical protein [Streptomyces sp. 900105245]